LHLAALTARYWDLSETLVAFADLAEAETTSWPRTDGLGLTSRSREILDELVERADRRSSALTALRLRSKRAKPAEPRT
jgi:hypothetical protein